MISVQNHSLLVLALILCSFLTQPHSYATAQESAEQQLEDDSLNTIVTTISASCSEVALGRINSRSALEVVEEQAFTLLTLAQAASDNSAVQLSIDCKHRISKRSKEMSSNVPTIADIAMSVFLMPCATTSLNKISSVQKLDLVEAEVMSSIAARGPDLPQIPAKLKTACTTRIAARRSTILKELKELKLRSIKSKATEAHNSLLHPAVSDTDEGIERKVQVIAEYQEFLETNGYTADAIQASEWLIAARKTQLRVNYDNSYIRALDAYQQIQEAEKSGSEALSVVRNALEDILSYLSVAVSTSSELEVENLKDKSFETARDIWKVEAEALVNTLELKSLRESVKTSMYAIFNSPNSKSLNELQEVQQKLDKYISLAKSVGTPAQIATAEEDERETVFHIKAMATTSFQKKLRAYGFASAELNLIWRVSLTDDLIEKNNVETPSLPSAELKSMLKDAAILVNKAIMWLTYSNQFCSSQRSWLLDSDIEACDTTVASGLKEMREKKELLKVTKQKLLFGKGKLYVKKAKHFLNLKWNQITNKLKANKL